MGFDNRHTADSASSTDNDNHISAGAGTVIYPFCEARKWRHRKSKGHADSLHKYERTVCGRFEPRCASYSAALSPCSMVVLLGVCNPLTHPWPGKATHHQLLYFLPHGRQTKSHSQMTLVHGPHVGSTALCPPLQMMVLFMLISWFIYIMLALHLLYVSPVIHLPKGSDW